MSIIDTTLHDLQVGEGKTFKNLTIFPLIFTEPNSRDYLTLDEALASETARVSEISDSGSVPELSFLNDGAEPVLLLDGEELVGAKQNRVLNLSILAPAGKTTRIPVSCVEQGRWAYRSGAFSSEDRVHFSRGRATKAASVSRSMRESGSRRSDQSEVWNSVDMKSASLGVSSPTQSMSDIYRDRARSIEGYVNAFDVAADQIGAIFAIDGTVAGLDLLETRDIFVELFPKLARSYALDATETADATTKKTDQGEADGFIEIVSSTPTENFPAVGLGNDLRLRSEMISGGGLVYAGRVVHLAAFPVLENRKRNHRGPRAHMTRASSRRKVN